MTVIDNSMVKLLIVDDTAENLEIAGRILQVEDYDIYIADSGQTALEIMENVQFDLILLDIMMPQMDGFETCMRIKSRPEWEGIPVIFLTAKVDFESMAKGFEHGAVDYIRKPFNPLELVARVKNHVELKKIREELENKNKKLEEAYAVMEELATTDPLTRLLNRREMQKKIEYEKNRLVRNEFSGSMVPFSVIIADIDFFKKVNDTYGHDCGDCILKGVADILKAAVRKQDYVARWGGEEFLLLLPETAAEGAAVLAEKLRSRLERETFIYNNETLRITMTFGVSEFSTEGTVNDLIILADKALYKGKHEGRNRVVTCL